MNLFDYLADTGKSDFSEIPFGEVDALCCCQLSYLPLEVFSAQTGFDAPPQTVSEVCAGYLSHRQACEAHYGRTMAPKHTRFARAVGSAPRFSGAQVYGFVAALDPDAQMQFAAMTIRLSDGACFIAFRGTDGTLVGWREDFNLGFLDRVPSQSAALSYLETAAARFPDAVLYTGGHSKGGNLAVYAAAFCKASVKARIRAVYCHDAPGFQPEVLESAAYRGIEARIQSFVPQTSIIGMLLSHSERYRVVHSNQHGLMQHDPYTWEVKDGSFVYVDGVNRTSKTIDRTVKVWVDSMDKAQQERFFDAVFALLSATEEETVAGLVRTWYKSAPQILKSFQNEDEETREMMKKTLNLLFAAAQNAVGAQGIQRLKSLPFADKLPKATRRKSRS